MKIQRHKTCPVCGKKKTLIFELYGKDRFVKLSNMIGCSCLVNISIIFDKNSIKKMDVILEKQQ